jgi:NAD(P)-dependent dehydrogenase (short-subunit alcohol dehydrogenase family)
MYFVGRGRLELGLLGRITEGPSLGSYEDCWVHDSMIDMYQLIDNHQPMSRVSVVTGATRNLGLMLVQGLAERLDAGSVVYLTGRDPARVAQALEQVTAGRAAVRGEVLDVSDRDAVARFATSIAERHGGVDIVFSNHYTRVEPEDDPAAVIDHYVAVNNLGTTHVLRGFAPLLRDRGRLLVVASSAGSLRALAPVLHARFDGLDTLEQVDAAVCTWRDAVRERRAPGEAWPAWINIPSKIGQVAAVRALARQRREDDLRRGILIAALCPGLIDTGASRPWLDMRRARTPGEAAPPLLDLALGPTTDPAQYGELIRSGKIVPWKA